MHEDTRQDGFGRRMPFYMTFPFSDNLFSEEESERDMEVLVSLYPAEARRIWPEVEDTCDRLEYDGSIMYDEYPDRFLVRRQVEGIRQRMDNVCGKEERELEDLIEILLYQEMYRRRCRRRRFKRHFIY